MLVAFGLLTIATTLLLVRSPSLDTEPLNPSPNEVAAAIRSDDHITTSLRSPTSWLTQWAERHGGRHIEVQPDTHWQDRPSASVVLDETFLLELAIGNHLDGYELLVVDHDGNASRLYPDLAEQPDGPPTTVWKLVDFRIERATLEALVDVLNDNRFLQLPASYAATDAYDGTIFLLHIRTAGNDKYVLADNTAPESIVNIVRAVASELIDARPELYATSRPAPLYPGHYTRQLESDSSCYQFLISTAKYGTLTRREYRQIYAHSCEKFVRVSTVPEEPLSRGTRIEAMLIDETSNGKVIARSSFRDPSFYFHYPSKAIKPTHRYAVQLKLVSKGKTLFVTEAVPALTGTMGHALSISLPRPAASH